MLYSLIVLVLKRNQKNYLYGEEKLRTEWKLIFMVGTGKLQLCNGQNKETSSLRKQFYLQWAVTNKSWNLKQILNWSLPLLITRLTAISTKFVSANFTFLRAGVQERMVETNKRKTILFHYFVELWNIKNQTWRFLEFSLFNPIKWRKKIVLKEHSKTSILKIIVDLTTKKIF